MENQQLEVEGNLSEENLPRQEVKEDVVVIGGKERPLRNFVAEIQRKTEESILSKLRNERKTELPDRQSQPVANDDRSNYISKILNDAEEEMTRTGRILPVETIISLITSGSQYHANSTVSAMKNAERIIKSAKKKLKEQHKDYKDYENEFEDTIDEINPLSITAQGLEMLFDSIMGRKIKEKMAKLEEEKIVKAERGEKIVGPSSGSGNVKSKKEVLTPEQQKEAIDMGFETEEDYFERLKKRQDRARSEGVKIIPQTLGEKIHKG